MGRRKNKLIIEEISNQLLSTAGDLVLFSLFFGFEYSTGMSPTSKGAWRAYDKAFDDFDDFDTQTIKNSLYTLKSKGLLETIKDKKSEHKITKAGKRHLQEILPTYDSERAWDGNLYLIMYDIAEDDSKKRDILRDFILKTLNCAMLQLSVWLTVYNPTQILREFAQKENLEGSILVPKLGKDGSIGRQSTKELLSEVYKLNNLNDRYKSFIWSFDDATPNDKANAIFEYLSILRDDPQLPFELLPHGWKGGEAYELYKEIQQI